MHDSALQISSSPGSQRKFISRTRLGMWWFLISEILTFGGVVTSYILMRLHHHEWIEESSHTLLSIGAINTVVLLTSSYTMVLAHGASEMLNIGAARKWLGITILLGLVFLGLKGFEYHHEISQGLIPSKSVFWAFYYCMTGLHALHVIGGLLAMLYLILLAGRPVVLARVVPVGLYWHFVDVVWIFLFPLLYVTSH